MQPRILTSFGEYSEEALQTAKAQWIEELVSAQFALIKLLPRTKAAYDNNWTRLAPDPSQTPDDFPDNYGVVLRDDILVVDVDPKNFEPGDNPFERLKADMGLAPYEEFDTYTVQSRRYVDGNVGLHIYFAKEAGINLRTRIKQYGKGIEVKSFGSQMVGPGSIHPETVEPYVVLRGRPDDLLYAPDALVQAFTRPPMAAPEASAVPTDTQDSRERYASYLAVSPPAITGDHGDERTFVAACKGKDLGLSELTVYEMMRDIFNPRCSPPWDLQGLATKVASAFRNGKRPPGVDHPSAAFPIADPDDEPVPSAAEVEVAQLEADRLEAESMVRVVWDGTYDANGRMRKLHPTIDNVKNHFVVPDHGVFKNPFYKLVRMNQFASRMEFSRPAPWHSPHQPVLFWRKNDFVQLRAYLSKARRFNPSKEVIYDAVISYAEDESYHPVREYFQSLKWDGLPRLERLFSYYANAPYNPYVRAVSRCTLIAAVARIMNPGCKHDHVPVMEGPQGMKKSQFCEVLGGQWHRALHLDPRNKDTTMSMEGAMIIELAEMTHTRKQDVDSIKAYITNRVDTIRRPYASEVEDVPRQSILIGTFNPGPDGTYLPDKTGNRRFWPITVGMCQIAELKRDRDQLFAEAFVAWQAGEAHYLTDQRIINLATIEQARRTNRESWADIIENRLLIDLERGIAHKFLSTKYIGTVWLEIKSKDLNQAMYRKVADAMTDLGWEAGVGADAFHKSQLRGWKNPNYKAHLDYVTYGV